MCGIFGYIGKQTNTGSIILDGLKSLEYRGYDSWGIALKTTDNNVFIEKHTGKIGEATAPSTAATMGIGHTRWATHGGVTEANAHPHKSCDEKVIIVHNGIVENFQELKEELINKGHTFKSETDTEVLAHLIEEIHKTEKDLLKVINNVSQKITGLSGIIAFFPEQETLYILKNGSPIVFGEKDGDFFIASDPSAMILYTKDVYFMEDKELLKITRDGYQLWDNSSEPKEISFTHLQYDKEDAALGDYNHFMIKEIHEQPKVLNTIINTQTQAIKEAAEMIKNSYGTYLVGCGTASYACLAGTYLFSKIAKRHVNFSIGSEFSYLNDFIKETSLIMALSQSGETIDIISSIKKAKEKNAKIIALTNVLGSTLYRIADYKMLLSAGPEKAVASTKAYTAKVAFLHLLAYAVAGNIEEGIEHIQKAISEIKELLSHEEDIASLARSIQNKDHMFVLGRGVSFSAALESALKIKEVSYIHAEGFACGELKHGPIALIESGTPVIIFNPEDETYEDTLSAAHEVKARGAYVIGISSKPSEVFDEYIEVKNCGDATIIPNVVIAQLLGYHLALAKGCDPDKPRNLAKSVTVK